MNPLLTLKELAAEMRIDPNTAGRWLSKLDHKPTVNGKSGGGYRFSRENADQFIVDWAAAKEKAKAKQKRKRKRYARRK